jgi:hypothetical protein
LPHFREVRTSERVVLHTSLFELGRAEDEFEGLAVLDLGDGAVAHQQPVEHRDAVELVHEVRVVSRDEIVPSYRVPLDEASQAAALVFPPRPRKRQLTALASDELVALFDSTEGQKLSGSP